MTDAQSGDVETRVEQFTRDSDLGWVRAIIETERDGILQRWLEDVTAQPFHANHPEHAVADDIPRLYDAIHTYLSARAPRRVDPGAPLEDASILEAAQRHARSRLDQGLQPVDVVTEFRLLRQEILGALRRRLPDGVPTGDVIAAELLINDALDGAVSVALRALTDLIETLREDFLATTIHDVRQPLAVIKGAAQLNLLRLKAPTPDLARVTADLERIQEAARRMEALLNTLIDASRIALNQLDLQLSTFDLADLVRGAIGQLDDDTAGRVALTVAPGTDTTGVWDRIRIDRVLVNLLSNAVKYSPPGSPISVEVRTALDHPAMIEVRVQDQGRGIAEAEMPRLFTRFTRGRDAIESDIEGLGLGLYLCRGIVVAHGGRIWATSPGPGQGSAFHMVLPRERPRDA